MRLAAWSPVGLLLLAGCATTPRWHRDLDAALAEARASGRGLYVLSILGDLDGKC